MKPWWSGGRRVCWLLLSALDLMRENGKLGSANYQLRPCCQSQNASTAALQVALVPVARGKTVLEIRAVIKSETGKTTKQTDCVALTGLQGQCQGQELVERVGR